MGVEVGGGSEGGRGRRRREGQGRRGGVAVRVGVAPECGSVRSAGRRGRHRGGRRRRGRHRRGGRQGLVTLSLWQLLPVTVVRTTNAPRRVRSLAHGLLLLDVIVSVAESRRGGAPGSSAGELDRPANQGDEPRADANPAGPTEPRLLPRHSHGKAIGSRLPEYAGGPPKVLSESCMDPSISAGGGQRERFGRIRIRSVPPGDCARGSADLRRRADLSAAARVRDARAPGPALRTPRDEGRADGGALAEPRGRREQHHAERLPAPPGADGRLERKGLHRDRSRAAATASSRRFRAILPEPAPPEPAVPSASALAQVPVADAEAAAPRFAPRGARGGASPRCGFRLDLEDAQRDRRPPGSTRSRSCR